MALPLLTPLGANAASPDDPFIVLASAEAPASKDQKMTKKRAAMPLFLELMTGQRAGASDNYVMASATPEATDAEKKCPQTEKKDMAEGAEETPEQTLVGPEPIYFAF
jgi:hypothetical protein